MQMRLGAVWSEAIWKRKILKKENCKSNGCIDIVKFMIKARCIPWVKLIKNVKML